MKFFAKTVLRSLLFLFLTILTQIGGVVYLCTYLICRQRKLKGWKGNILSAFIGLGMYLFFSLILVPFIAPRFGRVPLPYFPNKDFPTQPATMLTCLLNRHYVHPVLAKSYQQIAKKYVEGNDERVLQYLDANFPFFDGFPLLPHKSHDDGEKLDLAFRYKNAHSVSIDKAPGFMGYGYCEIPKKGEQNMPKKCEEKGKWLYSFLKRLTKQNLPDIKFDEDENRRLLRIISREKSIKKVFIEPHLKTRLGFDKDPKIRFHGCGAVRHDDHIHIQL